MLRMFGVFLALTALAAGAGTLAGLHLGENVRATAEARAVEEEPVAPNPDYAAGMTSHEVPAVVANLAAPSNVWIRIESSIVFSDAEIARPDILVAE
ncbi:MAG TPA: flagellar protein, partial [Paracoccaceae bacterium]|nr:flagellar protein [Paracoccaceae bacterium]